MKTAQEMYDYCLKKQYGQGLRESQALKNFSLISTLLEENEEVIMSFVGLHNYSSIIKHDGNYSYAVTTKRILLSQKRLIGKTLQDIAFDKVNDITYTPSKIFGILELNTEEGKINVAVDKEQASNINDEIQDALRNSKVD